MSTYCCMSHKLSVLPVSNAFYYSLALGIAKLVQFRLTRAELHYHAVTALCVN